MAHISITDPPTRDVSVWQDDELRKLKIDDEPANQPYELQFSKYNPTPGTGRTGVTAVPPNPYPFYNEDEIYKPVIQADGGQLSEWASMYAPTKEEAEKHRAEAYARGIPYGYKPLNGGPDESDSDQEDQLTLWVVSDLHSSDEYGTQIDPNTGLHSGGPFSIKVSPNMRVEQLRNVIRDVGGIVPALQKLSYAGKHLDDSQRTLKHYGIAYWHRRFPHWPIKIRRF